MRVKSVGMRVWGESPSYSQGPVWCLCFRGQALPSFEGKDLGVRLWVLAKRFWRNPPNLNLLRLFRLEALGVMPQRSGDKVCPASAPRDSLKCVPLRAVHLARHKWPGELVNQDSGRLSESYLIILHGLCEVQRLAAIQPG
jgi:hypothetical protein